MAGQGFKAVLLFTLLGALLVECTDVELKTKGFDFGGGCGEGRGRFEKQLADKKVTTVGTIPRGIKNPEIYLTSANDLDIQLYDAEANKPIVHWIFGILDGPKPACKTYLGVEYCYSGYDGKGGKLKGHEYIKIKGTTNRKLTMKAYAFAAGSGLITYSWKTGKCCCSGKTSGSFSMNVAHLATVSVGKIPAGKRNVRVQLSCDTDVDVQIVDREANKVIVGYPNGLINGASEKCIEYRGNKYCYSGYNGVDGKAGNEWIQIHGKGKIPVEMRAFGFAKGSAEVSYSFKKPRCCGSQKPGLALDEKATADKCRTASYLPYLNDHGLVVRRGGRLLLKKLADGSHRASVRLNNGKKTYAMRRKRRGDISSSKAYGIPRDMPIGKYTVEISGGGSSWKGIGKVFVIFNPYSRHSVVRLARRKHRKEYVEAESGLVFYGDISEGVSGIGSMEWKYHQFELLSIVYKLLIKDYPNEEFDHPLKVIRALSNSINSNLLWGRWDGNYEGGKTPGFWTGSRAIYKQWDATDSLVKYGQCWVFASLFTTAGRALGIPTRTETNFRSAHDSQPYDLVIETKKGESIWNFHVWNGFFVRNGRRGRWFASDSTPQEKSEGHYQCGPGSMKRIHKVASKHSLSAVKSMKYDVDFIAGEVAAWVWTNTTVAFDKSKKASYNANQFNKWDVGRSTLTHRPGKTCSTTQWAKCAQDLKGHYKGDGKDDEGLSLVERAATLNDEATTANFAAFIGPTAPAMGDNLVLHFAEKDTHKLRGTYTVELGAYLLYEDGTEENLPAGHLRKCRDQAKHHLKQALKKLHDEKKKKAALKKDAKKTAHEQRKLNKELKKAGKAQAKKGDGKGKGKKTTTKANAARDQLVSKLKDIAKKMQGKDKSSKKKKKTKKKHASDCDKCHRQKVDCVKRPKNCCCKETKEMLVPKIIKPKGSCECQQKKSVSFCKASPTDCCCGMSWLSSDVKAPLVKDDPSCNPFVKPVGKGHARFKQCYSKERTQHKLAKIKYDGHPIIDNSLIEVDEAKKHTTDWALPHGHARHGRNRNVWKSRHRSRSWHLPKPHHKKHSHLHKLLKKLEPTHDKIDGSKKPPSHPIKGDRVEHGITYIGEQLAGKTFRTRFDGTGQWKLHIPALAYAEHLWKTKTIGFRMIVLDRDEEPIYEKKMQVTLKAPVIQVVPSCGSPHKYEKFALHIKVHNPLPIPLTHLEAHIDGGGHDQLISFGLGDTAEPHGKTSLQSPPLVLNEAGHQKITVSVTSCQITGLYGSAELTVPRNAKRVVSGKVCGVSKKKVKKAAKKAVKHLKKVLGELKTEETRVISNTKHSKMNKSH